MNYYSTSKFSILKYFFLSNQLGIEMGSECQEKQQQQSTSHLSSPTATRFVYKNKFCEIDFTKQNFNFICSEGGTRENQSPLLP